MKSFTLYQRRSISQASLAAFVALAILIARPCTAPAAEKPPAAQSASRLLITGSNTMAPMVAELARRFSAAHPGVEITVEGGGSERGVADAREGKAAIGMVSRDLHANESDLFAISIARDGIAFVVDKDNPARGLTGAQASAVLAGTLRDWKALGGRNARIELVTRTGGQASLELVEKHFGIKGEQIKAEHKVPDGAALLRFITTHRHAMGFVSIGVLENAMRNGLALKPLALDTWLEERLDEIEKTASKPDVVQKAADLLAAVAGSREARSAYTILLRELQPHVDSRRSDFTESLEFGGP